MALWRSSLAGASTFTRCVVLKRNGTSGELVRDGARYRVIDDRSWDIDRRIADMDAEGVGLQVLSPIPVSYAYEATPSDAAVQAALQNETLAGVVRRRPDRFAALGTVPLQDVERACAVLQTAMRDFGLFGVEVGTSAGGRDLDDPVLEPFWQCCEELDAIVFIHPESAPGFERLRRNMLVISTGYPSETGIAAARSGEVDDRHTRHRSRRRGPRRRVPWRSPVRP